MDSNHLFVISAPSGAGKTSLISALLKQESNFGVAISHTTRPPREGEIDGYHYHFVTEEIFQKMISEDQFIEHATVFNHAYGTSKQAIQVLYDAHKSVILEIDCQGAMKIFEKSLPKLTSIFILPPSISVLKSRLYERGKDRPEIIQARLAEAQKEIEHAKFYDHRLINDDFDTTLSELKRIITHSTYIS